MLADLDERILILTDRDGHRLTHQFSETAWQTEEKPTRTLIRFHHKDEIKLSGRLVFHHQGDEERQNDLAKAFIRVTQPPERTLRMRYQGPTEQTHFNGTDRKTGEHVTTHFDLDTHIIRVTFEDGETRAFTLADDQWIETHPRSHRTRIDYRFDDGHTTLWGTLRLSKHKTIATVRLQQGQPYRATYKTMTGQPQSQAAAPNGLYYLHTNHLDTPQVITDENQQIVWQADYTPFGQTAITTNTLHNPLRFPGQYFDNETGLHYSYFRDYDPATGRYIQSDPAGILLGSREAAQRLNHLYSYALENPISYSDLSGLGPISFLLCTAANGAYTVYSFMDTMDELDSNELILDQLSRVDQAINQCPTEDTNRFGDLTEMRSQLVQAISENMGRTASSRNKFGLGDVGMAMVVEGVCGLLLLAPIP